MKTSFGFLIMSCILSHNSVSQTFRDITSSSHINHVFDHENRHFGGGVAILDFDKDGDEDIYLTGGMGNDQLYENLGNSVFAEVGEQMSITNSEYFTQGVVSGDFDNDGFPDLLISTMNSKHDQDRYVNNILLRNMNGQGFEDRTEQSGLDNVHVFSTSWALADINLDGLLDIYLGNWTSTPMSIIFAQNGLMKGIPEGSRNMLYLNKGDFEFEELAQEYQIDDHGLTWSVSFSDYDHDGDPDLFVANDFGHEIVKSALYRNEFPEPHFTDVSEFSGFGLIDRNAMGIASGDYNKDGWMDYYITDIRENVLYQNNRDGTFTDISCEVQTKYLSWTLETGEISHVSWGANFFDFNNDGDEDLFVVNGQVNPMTMGGMDTLYNPNYLFTNRSPGLPFEDVSYTAGLDDLMRGRGSAILDFDLDGDMDLMVVNQTNFTGYGPGLSPRSILYENAVSSAFYWLEVELEGTTSNRDAIGAKVRVVTKNGAQLKEMKAGSSHMSSESKLLHFGLNTSEIVDTLEVIWPGNKVQGLLDVKSNQRMKLVENDFSNGSVDWGYKPLAESPIELLAKGDSCLDRTKKLKGVTVVLTKTAKKPASISLYPNPSINTINIRLPEWITSGKINIEISNFGGQLVWNQELRTSADQVIQVNPNIRDGLYIMTIRDQNHFSTSRFRYIKN